MAGRQAKTLSKRQLSAALAAAARSRHAERNRLMLLLSVKAGLRAGEIAKLTWPMVLDATGRVSDRIELHDAAAKKGSGRTIPLNAEVRKSLGRMKRISAEHAGPVIRSERGAAMRPSSVVNWFARFYAELGYQGCSSHSGRRTFITNAARLTARVGGSLRDVQQLAGHSSIDQTQAYIEGNSKAKRRLVSLL